MVKFTILAGGYTTFFTRFLFESSPPSLTVTGTFPDGNNASWIELSTVNPNLLYATNENHPIGGFLSFALDATGKPTKVDNVSSLGADPAFGNAFGNKALVLNYNSGNGRFLSLSNDLAHFEPTQTITFQAPVGGVSHPHNFITYGDELLIADLGADKVWRLSETSNGQFEVTGFLPQPLDSGPRRVIADGDTLYVLHELSNTLSQQIIPASKTSTEAATITTIVTTQPGVNSTAANGTYHAAELLMPPTSATFPERFLYVSNRDTGPSDPLGDTIAIFATNPLRKVKEFHTGLNQIRGMEFGGPNSEFLFAAGLAGNGVAMLERIHGGADLKVIARENSTASQDRSTFVWLP